MFASRRLSDTDFEYLSTVHGQLAKRDVAMADGAVDYATALLERDLPVLFDVRHVSHVVGLPLNVLASMAVAPRLHYTTFRIRKRSGGSREITAPRPALKQVQEWIHRNLLSRLEPHDACHGFVSGRSIATNAEPHVQAELILKLDIKDFFPSVRRQEVFRTFRRSGYGQEVAHVLTSLTTYGGSLPQGGPSSPALANFAARQLDIRLSGLARQRSLTYTRYADDLTFSGNQVRNPKVKRLIERIVRDEGFAPNEKKARYLHPSHRQAVTGVVVNEKLNWPRDRRRWLRQEIYYLKEHGVEEHLERRGADRTHYKEFIYGHVYALKSVRPDEAEAMLGDLAQIAWPY